MRMIEITDWAYETIAERHGDVAAYVERAARSIALARPSVHASFYESALASGLLTGGSDYPTDLSSNPGYLEGLGR